MHVFSYDLIFKQYKITLNGRKRKISPVKNKRLKNVSQRLKNLNKISAVQEEILEAKRKI